MTLPQALKLAIEALDNEIQRQAIHANFHDKLGADYPYAVKASKKRRKLRQARAILEDIGFKRLI